MDYQTFYGTDGPNGKSAAGNKMGKIKTCCRKVKFPNMGMARLHVSGSAKLPKLFVSSKVLFQFLVFAPVFVALSVRRRGIKFNYKTQLERVGALNAESFRGKFAAVMASEIIFNYIKVGRHTQGRIYS